MQILWTNEHFCSDPIRHRDTEFVSLWKNVILNAPVVAGTTKKPFFRILSALMWLTNEGEYPNMAEIKQDGLLLLTACPVNKYYEIKHKTMSATDDVHLHFILKVQYRHIHHWTFVGWPDNYVSDKHKCAGTKRRTERLRLFKQHVDGLFNAVFELHCLTQWQERGESRVCRHQVNGLFSVQHSVLPGPLSLKQWGFYEVK